MVPAHSRPPSSNRRFLSKVVSLIFLLLLIPSAFGGAPAHAQPPLLLYFKATAVTDHILIEWETASELDVVGFQVQRSLQEDGGFVQIGDTRPAEGDISRGARYTRLCTLTS